ncbi:hypothetical protein ACHAXA_007140 [Cyclostephanos tholiformis]|uniref:Uncharacterized protein n=1 Tax=Cyclostephanos tholiformis TaxID=382380 RepID=A0ABD3RRW4_9STRA
MMRNASCDGRWDAANDDIDVALPSSISGCGGRGMADEPSSVVGSVGVGGDEIWLAQLATSIGISTDPSAAASVAVAGTTATSVSDSLLSPKMERAASSSTTKKRLTSRVPSTRNKDSKPKDEKEVMSFFDNLLKK